MSEKIKCPKCNGRGRKQIPIPQPGIYIPGIGSIPQGQQIIFHPCSYCNGKGFIKR